MQEGTIARLNEEKGFGFISIEGQEKDIFFHKSALVGVDFADLKQGDKLKFDVEQAEKGPNALNVSRI